MKSLCLVAIAAVLAGCGGTTIAFCSGGDEFCDNFFLKIGPDQTHPDEEDGEVDGPDPDAEATATAVLEAALKIARLTPGPIEVALANDRMADLVVDRPDLVGLWLIQASLGRLWEANDNVATTRFLDQNRSWLSTRARHERQVAVSETHLLVSGLGLFAAFAADLDPAAAEAALSRVDAIQLGGLDSVSVPGRFTARAGRMVTRAARATPGCCAAADLAAAAVVLCAAQPEQAGSVDPIWGSSCRWVAGWFAANVVLLDNASNDPGSELA